MSSDESNKVQQRDPFSWEAIRAHYLSTLYDGGRYDPDISPEDRAAMPCWTDDHPEFRTEQS